MTEINKRKFTARIGNDFIKKLTFTKQDPSDPNNKDAKIPIDMTGYSFEIQVRKCKSDVDTILSLSSPTDIDISDVANGNITISITDTVTTTLNERNAVYDLKWTTNLGIITTILEGNFQILETVTK